jgi:hypothetical protein
VKGEQLEDQKEIEKELPTFSKDFLSEPDVDRSEAINTIEQNVLK